MTTPGLLRRRARWTGLLLAAVAWGGAPGAAAAQDDSPLYLAASPADGSLQIQMGDLFPADGPFTQALHSGLPLRIRLLCELWKDGFFDSQRGRAEWRASVVYDPLDRRYRIDTGGAGTPEIAVDSLGQVGEVLEEQFGLPLRPDERGRYYYLGFVEVETLSLSDLEELQRWLRGDPAPAAGRRDDDENDVGRGVRSVLVRMLGLPARRFRVRSPTFEIGPPGPR
ncbi:MAG: DUF4390 domain-containing protein [Longimicrobiales bacterium]